MNWIADFRDPWTTRPEYNIKKNFEISFETNIEREIIKKSNHLTAVSEGIVNNYIKIKKKNVHLIENGFVDVPISKPSKDLVKFVNDQKKMNRIILGYFGTGGIGTGEVSGKDLNFLGLMLSEEKNIFEKFAFVLQGPIKIKKHNWGDRLLLLKNEELFKARANMKLIDVGVNARTTIEDANMNLGSKLYDYAASSILSWCLIPEGAKSIQAFKKKVGGVIISNPLNKEEVKRDAKKIIELFKNFDINKYSLNMNELLKYKRENQFKKFLEIIN